MKQVTTIGLDIAKSTFQVHGVDAAGHMVVGWHLIVRMRAFWSGQALNRGLRHFSCSIFVGWVLRHCLEDDEDNEIGLRARDYRARRGVPRGPLGRIGGG
jgi:hypothetical protein